MKRWFLVFVLSLSPLLAAPEAIVFYAILSSAQEVHKIYMPGDKEAPRPFYKRECQGVSPKHFTQAAGSATFIYYPASGELHFAISYTGLSSPPLMMHVQLGFYGEEGPILQTIFGRPYEKPKGLGWREDHPDGPVMAPRGLSGFISGTYMVCGVDTLNPPLSQEEEIKNLLRGGLYINLHTCLNQSGELRGQILPLSFPQ